jgi:hypothetical protein
MLRIAWLSGELRKEIGRINELENSRLLTACFERDLLVLERYAKRIEHVCWTAEQNLLDECGAIVVLGTSSRGLKPRYWFTPLGTYYLDVLAVWIQIGGELKYSRGRAPARALGGPLIDFIEAVANPILGDFALKTASLQDVIDLARRGVFRWH